MITGGLSAICQVRGMGIWDRGAGAVPDPRMSSLVPASGAGPSGHAATTQSLRPPTIASTRTRVLFSPRSALCPNPFRG